MINHYSRRIVTIVTTFLTSGAILLLVSEAFAFAPRVTQIPNNQWGCALCHVSPGGGGPRTEFGNQVRMFAQDGQNVKWEEVCELDADGDGASNGLELGDPMCAWRRGDPNPEAMVTDPNDPESVPAAPGGEEMPAGEMMAGEGMAGEGMAGEGMAGEGMAGEGMAGEGMAGEGMAGEGMAGEMGTSTDTTSDEGGCQSRPSRGLSLLGLLMIAIALTRRQRV